MPLIAYWFSIYQKGRVYLSVICVSFVLVPLNSIIIFCRATKYKTRNHKTRKRISYADLPEMSASDTDFDSPKGYVLCTMLRIICIFYHVLKLALASFAAQS